MSKKNRGIFELDAKTQTIMNVLDVSSLKNLFIKVYGSTDYPDGILDAYRHWSNSTPTANAYRDFFSRLFERLGIDELTLNSYCNLTNEQFVELLPEDHKSKLFPVVEVADKPASSAAVMQNMLEHHTSSLLNFNDNQSLWWDLGYVDQKYMYWNFDSVKRWSAVIGTGAHKTYETCRSSLLSMLDSEKWQELVSEQGIKNIVFLGAGAPTKEIAVVRSLQHLLPDSVFNVCMLDAAFYMMRDSERELNKALQLGTIQSPVNIKTFTLDFAHLSKHPNLLDEEGQGRSVFFILGGTFGNNDETKILREIRHIARDGDVFVVNADFYQTEKKQDFIKDMVRVYSRDEAKDLVMTPIRMMLDDMRIFSPIENNTKALDDMSYRRSLISTEVLDDSHALCQIPQTIGIELKIALPRGELGLSISKKYERQAFTDYVEQRGFDFNDELSNENQVVFTVNKK